MSVRVPALTASKSMCLHWLETIVHFCEEGVHRVARSLLAARIVGAHGEAQVRRRRKCQSQSCQVSRVYARDEDHGLAPGACNRFCLAAVSFLERVCRSVCAQVARGCCPWPDKFLEEKYASKVPISATPVNLLTCL